MGEVHSPYIINYLCKSSDVNDATASDTLGQFGLTMEVQNYHMHFNVAGYNIWVLSCIL